jgi:hypothetical protein
MCAQRSNCVALELDDSAGDGVEFAAGSGGVVLCRGPEWANANREAF